MSFDNKVCFITGAGSGIGRGLALALGARGAQVRVTDIVAAAAEATASAINATGPGRASAGALDVTDAAAVAAAIAAVVAEHGRLDLMINNAGIAVTGDARDLTLDHWRRVLDVNLMGVLYGSDAAYKQMAAQGSGHLVNIASLSGLIPFPSNVPYGTSKFAVVGLSLGLRAEGEALGVKVSVVCPGFIESNIYAASETVNLDIAPEEKGADIPYRKLPTEVAVEKILRGIERNQATIVFPAYAKLFWWLYCLNPRLIASGGGQMIARLRQKRRGQ